LRRREKRRLGYATRKWNPKRGPRSYTVTDRLNDVLWAFDAFMDDDKTWDELVMAMHRIRKYLSKRKRLRQFVRTELEAAAKALNPKG